MSQFGRAEFKKKQLISWIITWRYRTASRSGHGLNAEHLEFGHICTLFNKQIYILLAQKKRNSQNRTILNMQNKFNTEIMEVIKSLVAFVFSIYKGLFTEYKFYGQSVQVLESRG